MGTKNIVALIVIVLSILIQCAKTQIHLTVECTKCHSKCKFENCFVVIGGNFGEEICPKKQQCDIKMSKNIKIEKCSYDMVGNKCKQQLCVHQQQKEQCYTNKIASLQIAPAKQQTYWCGECEKTRNCKKCIKQSDNAGQINEKCIGQTCSGIGQTIVAIEKCTGSRDQYGNTCSYCSIVRTTSSGGLTTCLQKIDYLQFLIQHSNLQKVESPTKSLNF